MIIVNQIIQEARKWLGTVQGSAGHKQIIDGYNSVRPLPVGYTVKYYDHWCSTFITFIFDQLKASDLIGRECGVERHIQIFKQKGIWIENGNIIPQPGDIITYNWDQAWQPNDGYADHIGIVETVSGRTITVIEGNISRMVARRTIQAGNGYIRGYARPKYASTVSSGSSKPAPVQTVKPASTKNTYVVKAGDTLSKIAKNLLGDAKRYSEIVKLNDIAKPNIISIGQVLKIPTSAKLKDVSTIAKEVIANKWGKGKERKIKLEQAGYNYRQVQDEVNRQLGVTTIKLEESATTKKQRKGKWRFNRTVNVRSKPDLKGTIVAKYHANQTVNIEDTVINDGYEWGTYISYSGYRRYVALRPIGQNAYGNWV